jgi:hypothetical protein
VLIILVIAGKAGKSKGDYDFVSPLVGVGVILLGICFIVGYIFCSIIN